MIRIYYHLAVVNNWREITNFFFESLISSGLYEKCDSVSVVFVGSTERPEFDFSGLGKIKFFHGGDLDQFEFPTLQRLWEESFEHESHIFYFHSKVASFDQDKWDDQKDTIKRQYAARNYESHHDVKSAYSCTRRWLRRCLVEQFEHCLSYLEKHDIVCLKHNSNLKFFPSNFWWSKSSYIKSLGHPIMKKDRYDAEMWAFKEGVKVNSFIGKNDEYGLVMF